MSDASQNISKKDTTKSQKNKKPKLEKAIEKLVKQYFETVETHHEKGFLHEELIRRVERELFQQVITHTGNNESQSAKILGISRTTLRKKLTQHETYL